MSARKSACIFLFFSILYTSTESLDFPYKYTDPCPRNNPNLNECIKNSANKLLSNGIHGDPEYGMPNLEPLHVKEMKVNSSNTGAVGFSLNFSDFDFVGLSTFRVKTARIDLDQGQLVLDGAFPMFQLLGPYEVSGKILLIPISGSGKSNITLVNVDAKNVFQFQKVKKSDGQTYFDLKDTKITIETEMMYINFDNLFNGEKILGDTTNAIMNTNWKDILEDLKPSLEHDLSDIIHDIVKGVVLKIPFEKLFPPN